MTGPREPYVAVSGKHPCAAGLVRAAPPPEAPLPRDKKWILAVAVLGSTMGFVDESVVNVALPDVERSLHTTLAALQWVVNAYTLCMSALLLIGGAAADRFGRRTPFFLGLCTFTLASLACGLAAGTPMLIGARVVQGVGAALLIPCSLAIIGATFDEDERGAAVGIWSAASALAAGVGPLIGGLLVDQLSWRAAFFINPLIAVPTFIIAVQHLPERAAAASDASLDWPGAALAFLGLAALVFGLIASATLGWRAAAVEGSTMTGVLLLVALGLREARSRAPMLPLTLFRSRNFRGINLLTLLLYGALGGAFFLLPFLLIKEHGFSAAAAGAVYLPYALVLAVLSRWSGKWVDRFGARWPLIIGPLIVAAGFAFLSLIASGGNYWVYLVPMAILGLGMAIAVTPLTTMVIDSVERRETGVASAINDVSASVAGLLAVAVLGTLARTSMVETARVVMMSAALLAAAGAAVAALTVYPPLRYHRLTDSPPRS